MNRIICALLCLVVATRGQHAYQGILINGVDSGTQLYDPFNSPHAIGNLSLGIHGYRTSVIIGQMAYFGHAGSPYGSHDPPALTVSPSFRVYNCTSNTTTQLAPGLDMSYNYVLTSIGDGDVLACGGRRPCTSTCARYSPKVNTWTMFPPMPVAMDLFAMVADRCWPIVHKCILQYDYTKLYN